MDTTAGLSKLVSWLYSSMELQENQESVPCSQITFLLHLHLCLQSHRLLPLGDVAGTQMGPTATSISIKIKKIKTNELPLNSLSFLPGQGFDQIQQ